MRCRCLVLTVWCSLILGYGNALAQQSGASATTQGSQAAPPGEVPADAPVITFTGLCDNGLTSANPTHVSDSPAGPGAGLPAPQKALGPGCKTVVTRQQFELLFGTMGTKPSALTLNRFAHQYSDLLVSGSKGREVGIEKDQRFQEKAKFSYTQVLAQFFDVYMQRQADDLTDAEVDQYFKENPERFVRIHLLQIAVPKHKTHDDESGTKIKAKPVNPVTEQVEMHRVALSLQKQAAAGANVDVLEEKAYKIAGDDSTPDTDLGVRVPDQVPAEYRKLVFDLQQGQVSQVAEDSHEYLIFKCAKRDVVPVAERKKLVGWLRVREAKQALQDAVKTQFNDQYFSASGDDQEDAAP
jgi:hypothetical protein